MCMSADKVLPPILFACLPPFSRSRGAALSDGAALSIDQTTEAPALRGTLALLLRSISAKDPGLNYCSLAVNPSRRWECFPALVQPKASPLGLTFLAVYRDMCGADAKVWMFLAFRHIQRHVAEAMRLAS